MSSPSHSNLTPSPPGRVVIICAAYALVGGIVTLTGWVTGLPRLTDWAGSGIAMFANTAVAAMCAGAGLLILGLGAAGGVRIVRGLGLLTGLIGAATLSEHLFGIDLGIDTLLIDPSWGNRAATFPGRMGPPASLSFSLLGAALILAAGKGPARKFAPVLGLAVIGICSLSATGYLFQANPLFSVARFTGIALQTATLLLALGLGIVAAVPERDPFRSLTEDSAAGLLMRRALPFIVFVPITLAWLRLQGERAGFYDLGMGLAILVLSLITLLCGLLWLWGGAVRKHETALLASETRFRKYFELGLVGMAVITPEKGIVEVNDEMCRIVGCEREELIRKSWAEITHPDDIEADVAQYRRVLSREIEGYSLEKRFIRNDGGDISVAISARCHRKADGSVDYFVALAQDISERKKADKALRERTAEVEELNRRLQGAMAETHHRVKNNLQVIAAMIELYGLDDQQILRTEEIKKLGQHVRSLAVIHDLLTQQARSEQGTEYILTRDVISRLAPLLQSVVGTRQIRFEIENLPLAPRQGTSLAVLVNELVSNSVKHGAGDIDVALYSINNHARLEIADRGPGFRDGLEPLAAAKTGMQLVESVSRFDLQGTLACANRPDGGARVTIDFPLPAQTPNWNQCIVAETNPQSKIPTANNAGA